MYQIIVADHQELYRAGIVALLESRGECRVIAECSDWIGLVQALKEESASLIIASIVLVTDLEWLILRTQEVSGRVLLVGEDADSLNCYRATGAANGREAKYYTLTKAGLKALDEETESWRQMAGVVEKLLAEEQ